MNSTSLARPTAGRMAAAKNAYSSDGRTTASPERLVVLLYQRLVRDLTEAEGAIGRREIETSHTLLLHAQEIIDALDLALDREAWEGAPGLGSLYLHLHDRLVQANVRKDAAIVAECREMAETLSDAWRDAWGSLAAGT